MFILVDPAANAAFQQSARLQPLVFMRHPPQGRPLSGASYHGLPQLRGLMAFLRLFITNAFARRPILNIPQCEVFMPAVAAFA
jgi:hypothetical protein